MTPRFALFFFILAVLPSTGFAQNSPEVDQVVAGLMDSKPEVRRAAAEKLAKIEIVDDAAFNSIFELGLHELDYDVRYQLEKWFKAQKQIDPKYFVKLIDHLKSSPDRAEWELARPVASAFILRSNELLEFYLSTLKSDRYQGKLREFALQQMGKSDLNSGLIVNALKSTVAASSEDMDTRVAAASSLGRFLKNDPKLRDWMFKAYLREKSENVRASLVLDFAVNEEQVLFDRFVTLLKTSSDADLRAKAAEAISTMALSFDSSAYRTLAAIRVIDAGLKDSASTPDRIAAKTLLLKSKSLYWGGPKEKLSEKERKEFDAIRARISSKVPKLLLESKDIEMKRAAAVACSGFLSCEKADLIKAFESTEDTQVRLTLIGNFSIYASNFPEIDRVLLQAFDSKNEAVRMAAARLLIANKKLKGSKLVEAVQLVSSTLDETKRNKLLGEIEDYLQTASTDERAAIESALREGYLARQKPINLCLQICSMAEQSAKWLNPKAFEPSGGHPTDPWVFSVQSLAAYFIVKTAPFCPSSEQVKSKILSNILDPRHEDPACRAPDTDLSSLRSYAETLLAVASAPPVSSTAVYGKQYFLGLLKEYDADQNPKLKQLMNRTEAALKSDIQYSPQAPLAGKGGSSFFTTYALASALAFESDPKGVEFLLNSIQLGPDAVSVSYFPISEPSSAGRSSARGSAGRAVPTYLALYLNTSSESGRVNARKNLKLALQNFVQYQGSLIFHTRGSGVHVGDVGIAPYYYFPSVPFATEAVRLLLKDASPEERPELEKIKNEITAGLSSTLDEKGTFTSFGTLGLYSGSETYTNSLGGLALISLLNPEKDGCAKQVPSDELSGIVPRGRK